MSVRPRSARSDGALLGRRRLSWASNPEGDLEICTMNALDGSVQKNLTNNGADVRDYDAHFSRPLDRYSHWRRTIGQAPTEPG